MTMNLMAAVRGLVKEKRNIKTRAAVRNDLIEYLDYLGETFGNHDPQITDLTEENIDRFSDVLVENEYGVATIRRRLTSLLQLGYWCYNQGLLPKPLKLVIPAKNELRPKGLTPEQEADLRRAGYQLLMGGEKGLKVKEEAKKKAMGALALCLLETGLRIEEAANLNRVQIKGDELKSVRGKGRSVRDVDLTDAALEVLGMYLASRRDNDPRLFQGVDSTLFRWIQEVGVMIGMVDGEGKSLLHPHLLRHTFAGNLYDKTKDIILVKDALGHKSIETTMIYTKRTKEQKRAALNLKQVHA
jgi:integrase